MERNFLCFLTKSETEISLCPLRFSAFSELPKFASIFLILPGLCGTVTASHYSDENWEGGEPS